MGITAPNRTVPAVVCEDTANGKDTKEYAPYDGNKVIDTIDLLTGKAGADGTVHRSELVDYYKKLTKSYEPKK